MKQKIIGAAIGLALGIALALLQVHTIGFTAAIATPHWFSNLVLNSGYGTSLAIIWELMIVQFIGAGIPTLLTTFILLKFIPFDRYWKALGLVVGAIGGLFTLYPAPDYLLSPAITHHLYEIMVIACVSAMSFLFYKNQNSSNTTNQKIQGV